ncbi:response regulator, partial [Streptomyces rhizosphaericus]|uniref:response regulator n=1 Tax=Streptomyces rhizosphaericus TaxID=114699 RepID=UPI001FC94A3A
MSPPQARPGDPAPIRVLVVEDDPVAADAHRMYVERVPGFAVVGAARSGGDAQRLLERTPADLLLLDLYLPDGHGLQLVRALRAAGNDADVIAVTSARDLAVVRDGVSLGVVQYVLKPFTFSTLRDRVQGGLGQPLRHRGGLRRPQRGQRPVHLVLPAGLARGRAELGVPEEAVPEGGEGE